MTYKRSGGLVCQNMAFPAIWERRYCPPEMGPRVREEAVKSFGALIRTAKETPYDIC